MYVYIMVSGSFNANFMLYSIFIAFVWAKVIQFIISMYEGYFIINTQKT